MNTKYLKDVKLVNYWQKTLRRFVNASENLEEKLDAEANITEYRRTEILGLNAYKNWNKLVKIVKTTSIKKAQNEASELREKERIITDKLNDLKTSRDELSEAIDEINRNETVKQVIKSELKNKQMNIENKKLAKYKAKTYVQSKKIVKVVIGNETLTNPDKIKEGIKTYYSYQFRCGCKNTKSPKICSICNKGLVDYSRRKSASIKRSHMRIKKVTNSMRYKMDEDITIEELDKYVKSHLNKKLKSPGPDGIPYEFILTLWSDLRRLIYNIIRWMFKNKIMPEKLPEGLIVFLPKKGKDQSILKNLRPLTLLNTLYKIASGILAERIKGILPKIISRDQYSFVNGRQAADLIQLAKELIDESRKTKQNLAVFAIDFSGAFDNISYKAIIDALLKKGFGGNFVTNIATLLTNNQSKIVIKGKCKGGIKIEKSCRQGDPISPYLFIILLDELLDSLNNNKKLKGYKVKCKGKEIKIKTAAFADDCYTFLSGNKKCIKNQVMIVKKILKEFEKKTGLAINVNKSELTTSGPIYNQIIEANEPERKIANISHKEEIKMLGVNVGIGADLKRDVVGRIAKSIECWNRFRFSEIEKIDISNAFILPSVTHIIRHIPYESLLENQVNKLVLDFVWNKRRRYTNINVVQERIKKGGLNMRRFGETWLNVLMGWFWRMYNADKDAAVVLDIGNQKYNRSRGFDIKHFLNVATTPEKRLKRKSNVFESSINLMEN